MEDGRPRDNIRHIICRGQRHFHSTNHVLDARLRSARASPNIARAHDGRYYKVPRALHFGKEHVYTFEIRV